MSADTTFAQGVCLTLSEEEEKTVKSYLPPNGAVKGIADFFFIFADSTRLRIISALSVMELCVGDMCWVLRINQTTLSHQLKLLRDAGIVGCRRMGKIIFYRIINPYVDEVMLAGANHVTAR